MAYLSDDELLDTEGGFTGWDAGAEETLEQALAEERLAELKSELEQDEHPIDYEAELEDEEEEAAPVSDKRLKTGDVGRGHTAAGGSSTHGEGFPGRGGGMEQAGPEPGARNGTTKTSVGMCRWNIRRCRNRSSFPAG